MKCALAFDYADITNTSQVAAFWALGGTLTSNFETFKELGSANCQYYDGGCTYTGRGVFMMSGSATYRQAGQALGQDFEHDPELVLQHTHAFKTAAWLWKRKSFDDNGRFWTLAELSAAATSLGITSLSQQAITSALYIKSLACLASDHVCTWYTVAQGDTPSSIAAAQGVTVEELVSLNNWSGPNQTLTAGETIKLYCT